MKRKGMALAVILMATTLLFVVAVGAVTQATTDLQLVTSRIHAERAFYAAEAGVQAALVEIDKRGYLPDEFRDYQPVHPGGPDSFQVTNYQHSGSPPDGTDVPDRTHYLIATGKTDRGTVRKVAVLCTRNSTLFNQGILAETLQAGVDGTRGSQIDAWDSGDHPIYDPEYRVYGLDVISTNSVAHHAIRLSDDTYVHGVAHSGPGSDPHDVIAGGHVDDKLPLTSEIVVGAPAVPSTARYHPNTTVFDGVTDDVYPGRYDDIRIRNGAVVTFHPGKYVVGTLNVTNGGKLKVDAVDTQRPVLIYVNEHMDLSGRETVVNTLRKASLLRIIYAQENDTLEFSGGADAFLTVQAPKSDINFHPAGTEESQAFGAMQARNVVMDHARFHYDVNLRQDGYSTGQLQVLSHRRL